jgi:F-type H+-transporting ATPase subunit delta
MAESLTIARPYAEAAFKIARDQNALPAWSDALGRLANVLQRPEAMALISYPALSAAQITGVITETTGELSDEQRNFIGVLAGNDRLTVLPEIAALFGQLRNAYEQVLEAHVDTAYPLTDAQVADIRATLENKYGKKVEVLVVVDPDLIGGVSIRIGDVVMDASVRGKLAQLAAALVTH